MGCTNSSHNKKCIEKQHVAIQCDEINYEFNGDIKRIYIKSENYLIHDEIYRGTISQVFNGTLKTLNGQINVACKKIKWSDIQKYNIFGYILKEILLGMSLENNAFVVKYYGIGNDNENIYIITEKYGDINLSELIHIRTPPYYILCNYALQILHIILWLHSKNIVHRDIKLSNFLINNGIIKICDFGAATTKRQRLLSLCGTLSHMAPEIMRSEEYNFTVDYWSFAFVLIELFGRCEIDMVILNKTLTSCLNTKATLNNIIKNEVILDICTNIINNYKLQQYINTTNIILQLNIESQKKDEVSFNLSPLAPSYVSNIASDDKNNTFFDSELSTIFDHIEKIEVNTNTNILYDNVDKQRYTISSDDIDMLAARLTTT